MLCSVLYTLKVNMTGIYECVSLDVYVYICICYFSKLPVFNLIFSIVKNCLLNALLTNKIELFPEMIISTKSVCNLIFLPLSTEIPSKLDIFLTLKTQKKSLNYCVLLHIQTKSWTLHFHSIFKLLQKVSLKLYVKTWSHNQLSTFPHFKRTNCKLTQFPAALDTIKSFQGEYHRM